MTCSMCGAQNNPGVAVCYNCGGALAQTIVQPQQQWAQQPAQPVQQQWAPQQPAPAMTPDTSMGFSDSGFGGAAQPSSWGAGAPYDFSGHSGGGKGLKIVAISVVGVLLLGGGTLVTLWATGVIWSGSEVEGRWTDSEGDLVEFQEDGDLIVEEMGSMGFQMKWKQDGDEMTWTMKPDSQGTPMFECDDGDTIPLDFVNDDDDDCYNGEDEDISQSIIDSRTVYEDSEMDMIAIFDLRFEIVEDVMFIKINSIEYEFDGETEQEDGDDECIVFVRREVADTQDEWSDAISNVEIPSWCNGVNEYNEDPNQSDGPSMYVLSAQDHSDDVEEHGGLMTLTFGNGNDLDWALVQIEIITDSVPTTCDNPDNTGGNCGAVQHGGQDAEHWEKGETLVINDTGANFCDADCDLTVRIKYNGDVIMSEPIYLE